MMATLFDPDPLSLFARWYGDAAEHELNDPNAMTLATLDPQGFPQARIVLMKAWDARGMVFYTNLDSDKGQQLRSHPQACLNFHWKSLGRQVRITGNSALVTDEEADIYFATRPRDSQIGAWASDQSRRMDSRATFEARIAGTTSRFSGVDVPRPPHWSGFRLAPLVYEFWQGHDFRWHERCRYTRTGEGWHQTLLYP